MQRSSPPKLPLNKKRLVYGRKSTMTECDRDILLNKNPELMTDEEKVQWKVEIFKMCEDTDDIIEGQK